MDKCYSVYGTLRKGEKANYMLKECEFIGLSKELLPFKMVDLGAFPALMTSDENNELIIETYKLPQNCGHIESRLDMYEGYDNSGNGLYNKKLITLKSGIQSYIYFMNSEDKLYHGIKIESGDWLNR